MILNLLEENSMKVICKKTSSADFDLKEVKTVLSNDFDYTYGGYGLELNKMYLIMGIATYVGSNCIYYLIDVNGKPDWFPYLLFEIVINELPENWFFNSNFPETDISWVLGYYELCNISEHYNNLLEREESSLSIYFKRKSEIEENL
jgi:hypothetical protein